MPENETTPQKPYCCVSYSTREPHVLMLIDCLRIVVGKHFRVELTPSALESGASQRDQVTALIEGCAFAVVILDGLRPNVIFEYGILHGKNKPVILLKGQKATVDIPGYYGDAPGLEVNPVEIDLDKCFSDVKDVNYARWNRFDLAGSVKIVWEEYRKKKDKIEGYIEIEEPRLW